MTWLYGRLAEPSTWGGIGMVAYFVGDILTAWASGDAQEIVAKLLPIIGGGLAMLLPERNGQ